MGSSVKDCGGRVNDGTSCGNAKENAGSLANAEYCDERHKEDGRNDKDGLHICVCVKRGLNPLGLF